jgi:hypothetical protein
VSASPLETLVRDYIDAVFNRHELEDLTAYWQEDLTSHWMGQRTLHGLPQWRQGMKQFFTAFPDIRYRLDDLFFDGDRGVWRGSWSGRTGWSTTASASTASWAPSPSRTDLGEGRRRRRRARAAGARAPAYCDARLASQRCCSRAKRTAKMLQRPMSSTNPSGPSTSSGIRSIGANVYTTAAMAAIHVVGATRCCRSLTALMNLHHMGSVCATSDAV